MNSLIYKASEFQGEVFALSINNASCSSLYFMRRFLNSDAIIFLDQDVLNFAVNSPGYIIYKLSLENKSINQRSKQKLPQKVLYWIGFMYRFICASKNITSKKAYQLIKPRTMIDLYPSLHTQSPEYVTDYIMEKYDNLDKRNIEKIKKIYGLH